MFIITAKVRKGRIVAVAAAAAVVCGVLVAAAGLLGGRGAAASAAVSPKGVRTNEDRIAYLESYGWSVSSDPIAVEELIIPEQFDETYSQYLELQASQGFDLTDYCGKRVKRYTYEITNYPTGESGIQAGLLVYKSTVIGGDVLSAQLGGFIHGLEMPAWSEGQGCAPLEWVPNHRTPRFSVFNTADFCRPGRGISAGGSRPQQTRWTRGRLPPSPVC